MEVNQIGKADHLKEIVAEASNKLQKNVLLDHLGGQDHLVCMLKILAPAGYHQGQDIAEALGLEFDENLANEWNWDSFRQKIQDQKSKLVGDLHACFQLPDGLFLSFGYDQEGNFGLILKREREDKGKMLLADSHCLRLP